ncbi:MAG TPA: cytochrome c [Holophaga sp.]|nr:cytochrome c [Holophaga sp.]
MRALRSALVVLACGLAAFAGDPKAPKFTGDVDKYWIEVCARCHGANGNGRDNAGKPLPDAGFDFTDSRKANRKKDASWIKDILEGHDKMPAYKDKMDEAGAKAFIAKLRKFAA